MKQNDWIETKFEKNERAGVVPKKSERNSGKDPKKGRRSKRTKSSKKRTVSVEKKKRKQKRRTVSSVAVNKKTKFKQPTLDDNWSFNSNVFNQ
jgi:hypothetical protein